MTHEDLESVYEALARQLDQVGEDKAALYLAKLALILSRQIGTAAPVLAAIETAGQSFEDEAAPSIPA